ncbi:unnamed protein product [Urochloa humidicola]
MSMEPSQPLRIDAKPYIPLAALILPPSMAQLPPPPPPFFPQPAPYPYQAPPPQASFPTCEAVPLGPGGVGMQASFPHPPWAPLALVSYGAIAMPAATTPCAVTATAMPLGGGMDPPRSVRAPGARPLPRLDVPPRVQRPARPGPGAATAKAAGIGGNRAAKEETAPGGGAKASVAGVDAVSNEPSPRSVLVSPSPPISPTAPLPSSFPLPCPPPASAAAPAPPTTDAPAPHSEELGTGSPPAAGPPERWRQRVGPRRAQRPAPGGEARRGGVPKPRLLYDPACTCTRTSLMVRNIPNHFTRKRLMSIIDEHCFIENQKITPGGVKSEYDFLYVPIDFRTLANKGYAFVNMTSPEAARRLWEHLHDHRWEVGRCAKTCAVDYAAKQGLEKLRGHFSESSFDCDTEEFLPVWFEPPRDGTRSAAAVVNVVGGLRRCS